MFFHHGDCWGIFSNGSSRRRPFHGPCRVLKNPGPRNAKPTTTHRTWKAECERRFRPDVTTTSRKITNRPKLLSRLLSRTSSAAYRVWSNPPAPQHPRLKTSTIKLLRADTLKQWPNVLLTCFERTLRRVVSQNMQSITTQAPSAQVFSTTYLDLHLQGRSSSTVPQHDGPPGDGRPSNKPSHIGGVSCWAGPGSACCSSLP